MRVLVLGAGVAGLAAARALKEAGQQVIVLEAKDRLGGRTYTNRDFASVPVEFGAEFIHGERAATWELVRALGLETLPWPKQDDSLVRLEDGRLLSMREARSQCPDFDLTRSWALPEVDALPGEDFHSYLRRIGFSATQLRYVRRSFANACGESMRFLSARAVLEGLREGGEESGSEDFRLLSGYDALVRALAAGLEVHLHDPVTEVRWSPGTGVHVRTLGEERYDAEAAIITVPLGVLQAGAIRFSPELPDAKQSALLGLKMGPVIKLVYRFAEAPLPPHVMALYSRLNPPMWWSPSFGHTPPAQEHVWTAFVSGDWASELLSLGEAGALEAALASFRSELGRPELTPLGARLVNWPDDPYTRGGYSFVLPGHDGAREKLAAPTPPLFWAGEATEPEHRAATVHGALLSGRRAAAEVCAHLARSAHRGGARAPDPVPERAAHAERPRARS
ncbi:flavin monoamine oxidase family protein [Truepera radiovictrix]|uniref:Amine oxidase n=1 Tax=Truepera radiovictrix (strain DSM 17093 / CIP 108686 / LMG 22925 / RQ-24) TaxID=649638 RepID=D7CXE0_TRURR|nr:NAD(P)/FAD-dependent oxidoreductase [Truepera radiovictrix]ADI13264.1 amine oxidase [Truepera radiovictrix DSM 17093]WMT58172.1 NAD(P)/FAD-dependent oxidoreductase [Truepera radiovictrix]